ncbi:type III secretion system chaperone [Diaphorobacter caeni]|uniref:type III secretion system chaperone n=1 Tax=Diaphorobacter caeni TaxID=2784387 RepID=UPI0018901CCE|nr:type III secretion system chaperone [Diaphorobacter caeni]MBF5005615.1 type III secretion system chaperone [Diaphorobacter caeni]
MPSPSPAELLTELGSAIGIPALCLDAQGCCRLMFDGSRLVEMRHVPAQGRWLLTTTLHAAALSSEGWQLLLRGNLVGGGFGGGWAGLDEQGRAVLHLPMVDADASGPALLQAVELLLNHADRWDKRLMEGASTARTQAPVQFWAQRI